MNDIFKDYLSILQLPVRKPDLSYLNDLINRHLMLIPFENISKIYYKKKYGYTSIPDFDLFLSGIKENHFGGTCYSTNYYFNQLLKHLEYDAILCGADMANPDVHIVNIVKLKDREFIVDVGYAAPFLEPMPLDLSHEYIIRFGYDEYILLPKNKDGFSQINLFRNNSLAHKYIVKPYSRSISEFRDVIKDSYKPDATFMNSILLTKFGKHSSTIIRDLSIINFDKTVPHKREFSGQGELISEIVSHFKMPREIVTEVVEAIPRIISGTISEYG